MVRHDAIRSPHWSRPGGCHNHGQCERRDREAHPYFGDVEDFAEEREERDTPYPCLEDPSRASNLLTRLFLDFPGRTMRALVSRAGPFSLLTGIALPPMRCQPIGWLPWKRSCSLHTLTSCCWDSRWRAAHLRRGRAT